MTLCIGVTGKGLPCRRPQEEGRDGFCAFHDPDGQFRAAREARRLRKAALRKARREAQRERQLREIAALVAGFEERYKERKAARSCRSRA
jgi:hypothetical protein